MENQRQGNRYDEEYRIVQPNGHLRWVHDRAVPVKDDEGTPYRIVGLAEDITPRKEREQQIMVLNRVLRHNLRNEVNAIQAYAELIASKTDGEIERFASKIEAVASRLITLSEKNRTFATQLSEQTTNDPVDLGDLLTDVVTAFQSAHPDADISLTAPDSGVATVSSQLEIPLSELLENAIKHNNTETPTVEITATVDSETSIKICDNGSGIPDEEWAVLGIEELPLYHGSGIGLWLSHWVITSTGGTLTLEKNSSDGSTVLITCPRLNQA